MHRLVILLVLLWGSAHAGYNYQMRSTDLAWVEVCKLIECGGLRPPLVTIMYIDGDSSGFHVLGSYTIYVDKVCVSPLADDNACNGVMVHELLHYVAYWNHQIVDVCASEKLAWETVNTWHAARGELYLVVEDWLLRYPHCVKSPNDSTSSATP